MKIEKRKKERKKAGIQKKWISIKENKKEKEGTGQRKKERKKKKKKGNYEKER